MAAMKDGEAKRLGPKFEAQIEQRDAIDYTPPPPRNTGPRAIYPVRASVNEDPALRSDVLAIVAKWCRQWMCIDQFGNKQHGSWAGITVEHVQAGSGVLLSEVKTEDVDPKEVADEIYTAIVSYSQGAIDPDLKAQFRLRCDFTGKNGSSDVAIAWIAYCPSASESRDRYALAPVRRSNQNVNTQLQGSDVSSAIMNTALSFAEQAGANFRASVAQNMAVTDSLMKHLQVLTQQNIEMQKNIAEISGRSRELEAKLLSKEHNESITTTMIQKGAELLSEQVIPQIMQKLLPTTEPESDAVRILSAQETPKTITTHADIRRQLVNGKNP